MFSLHMLKFSPKERISYSDWDFFFGNAKDMTSKFLKDLYFQCLSLLLHILSFEARKHYSARKKSIVMAKMGMQFLVCVCVWHCVSMCIVTLCEHVYCVTSDAEICKCYISISSDYLKKHDDTLIQNIWGIAMSQVEKWVLEMLISYRIFV